MPFDTAGEALPELGDRRGWSVAQGPWRTRDGVTQERRKLCPRPNEVRARPLFQRGPLVAVRVSAGRSEIVKSRERWEGLLLQPVTLQALRGHLTRAGHCR